MRMNGERGAVLFSHFSFNVHCDTVCIDSADNAMEVATLVEQGLHLYFKYFHSGYITIQLLL